MSKHRLLSLLLIICIPGYCRAYFEFNERTEKAYISILSLHFEEAEYMLGLEKKEKPGNHLVLLYENYIDFLKAFLSENNTVFGALKANSEKRIEQITGDKNNISSPFFLYSQSEILVQLALVRIKFGENLVSATEIRKAYKLIEKNQKLFPSFILNKKVSGFLHAIVGSVPPKYSWALKLAGMQGNLSSGLSELESFYRLVNSTVYDCYRSEAIFYLGNLNSVFAVAADSVPLLDKMKQLSSISPLITYVYVNILMKQGKNDEALTALNVSLSDSKSYPFTFLYYKRGLARLRKLDLTASDDFRYFLSNFKGNSNIKAAYQKLAWIARLKGDNVAYRNELNKCVKHGALMLDDDKDAYYESISNEPINVVLLKSRLLFDGGYYQNSLKQITDKTIGDMPSLRDQLEVTYRLGRIMQMTGRTDKAITYYESTLKNGERFEIHFAANSSLLLGNIYEQKLEFDKALYHYKKCLAMNFNQYKISIDQKAQAGIERIKEIKSK